MLARPLVIVLVFFAAVAGLIIGFRTGRALLVNASMGEALVADALSRFGRPHVLLNNITLPTHDATTQIDHILVAETGIFVIETKHYKGWILGNPSDDYWTQVIFQKKSRFRNPVRQNYGHLRTVQALFNLPETVFIGVVVFTGEAEFKSDLGTQVLHLEKLLEFVGQGRDVILDERKMAFVVGRIEMKRLPRSLETDEYHVNYVRSRVTKA